MKQITIGFSRASTKFPIFSWLIMAVQKTTYSHVYVKYFDDEIQRTIYYQASHTLVNSMGEATFLGQEKVVQEFDFQISDKSWIAVQQFMADNAGKPYGVMEVCGLAVVEAALLVGIKTHNPLKDAGATWICNQMITSLLTTCEDVKLTMPLDDMTPKDSYKLISTLPATLSVD